MEVSARQVSDLISSTVAQSGETLFQQTGLRLADFSIRQNSPCSTIEATSKISSTAQISSSRAKTLFNSISDSLARGFKIRIHLILRMPLHGLDSWRTSLNRAQRDKPHPVAESVQTASRFPRRISARKFERSTLHPR